MHQTLNLRESLTKSLCGAQIGHVTCLREGFEIASLSQTQDLLAPTALANGVQLPVAILRITCAPPGTDDPVVAVDPG